MPKFLEKYDKNKIYYFQDGKIADYNTIKQLFPVVDILTCVVFTDYKKQIIISFNILNLLRTDMEIDPSLTEDQAIAKILEKINQPETQDNTIIRMADALEDLVVLNMPDEEV